MSHSPCPRGDAARGPAGPDGSLPWFVDSLLVLCGFEAVGDLIDLLAGGIGAATLDAAVDAAAAVACDVMVAVAIALGLDDGPLGGHGAQVLAMLAKLWGAHRDTVVAGLVARAILRALAPDRQDSIRRSTGGGIRDATRTAGRGSRRAILHAIGRGPTGALPSPVFGVTGRRTAISVRGHRCDNS